MYVTRPLSMYRENPSNRLTPLEAPDSGYIVIMDREEERDVSPWGCLYAKGLFSKFPLPQNTILLNTCHNDKLLYLPVLDQPLSSNLYYVIQADGKYIGKVCRCSKEEDMTSCCFRNIVEDVEPKPFDHQDEYLQMEICSDGVGFYAKSIVPNSFPPIFLRNKGHLFVSSSPRYQLDHAQGLDSSLRMHLPGFSFSISNKRSTSLIIGTWYCPFLFVKEQATLKYQMKNSLFYKLTLEQYWEEIYSHENNDDNGNIVMVNASVQREVNILFGRESVKDKRSDNNGFIQFRAHDVRNGEQVSVGLSSVIVERMRWVQELGGWVDGEEGCVKVERLEEIRSEGGWRKLACYVLVESFVLKKMDGSLVLNCDFRHTHKIRCKWE